MFFVLKCELILIIGSIMCLRRAPEKYIAGAALDRAGVLGWRPVLLPPSKFALNFCWDGAPFYCPLGHEPRFYVVSPLPGTRRTEEGFVPVTDM
jgi:hypothetical protein